MVDANVSDVAVGDVNRDGIQDIAAALTGGDSFVGIYVGMTDGTYYETTRYLISEDPDASLQAIHIHDVDLDGNLDLIVAVRDFISLSNSGGAAILLGAGRRDLLSTDRNQAWGGRSIRSGVGRY